MSTQGQGDGGVYFSMLGPASFGYGTEEGDQYERNLIADCFGEERMLEYKGRGRLDLVLVCAVEEGLLSPAPGGRDNATVTKNKTKTKQKTIPFFSFYTNTH
jgi:hypothetical protein